MSTEIIEGNSFQARVPFAWPESMKVHIEYVLPSKAYAGETLIIYKVYGKHHQWWHEFMCTKKEMEFYIDLAKGKYDGEEKKCLT
jgi:hypothetical protein